MLMEFTITVLPQEKQFVCQPGETILNASIRANINISYGCRQGLCGSCVGSIISGQTHYLSEPIAVQGISHNQILFCQAIPLTNVTIKLDQSRSDKSDEIKSVSARIKTVETKQKIISMGLQISAIDEFEMQSLDGFLILSNSNKYWIVIQEINKTDNITNIKFDSAPAIKKARFKSNDIIKLQGPYRSIS